MLWLWNLCFFKLIWSISFCIALLLIIYILFRSTDSGDDPWVWVPFLILLPFIAVPVYFIYTARRAAQDRMWHREQMKAHGSVGAGRGYVSRRVTSEKELIENYNKGKARRG